MFTMHDNFLFLPFADLLLYRKRRKFRRRPTHHQTTSPAQNNDPTSPKINRNQPPRHQRKRIRRHSKRSPESDPAQPASSGLSDGVQLGHSTAAFRRFRRPSSGQLRLQLPGEAARPTVSSHPRLQLGRRRPIHELRLQRAVQPLCPDVSKGYAGADAWVLPQLLRNY